MKHSIDLGLAISGLSMLPGECRTCDTDVLPCPLCGSQLILAVLRCATNCDVKLELYHCNHCGMEAPRHSKAS